MIIEKNNSVGDFAQRARGPGAVENEPWSSSWMTSDEEVLELAWAVVPLTAATMLCTVRLLHWLHVGNFECGAAKCRSTEVGWHFAQRSQPEWPWAPSPDRARRRGSAVDAAVVTFLLPKQSSLPQVLVTGTVDAVAGTVAAVAAMRADVLGCGLGQGDAVQVAGAILGATLALALPSSPGGSGHNANSS
jgi:hypothetical protein